MARTERTEPTPAVITEPDPFPVAAEPVGTLPAGVEMTTAPVNVGDAKSPPAGWMGSFARCGGCGDFIGNAKCCPKCAPSHVPNPVQMAGLPVMVAR
jgi:hypothetical protein